MIVSDYIKNPFLINNSKFDLWIYAAITSINPLKIFIYWEGLVWFATEKYDNNNTDIFTHLTNFSINKKNKKFFTDEKSTGDGFKWKLETLKEKMN